MALVLDLGHQRLTLLGMTPERLDASCHFSEFVIPIDKRNFGMEVTLRQIDHPSRKPVHRRNHAIMESECGRHRHRENDRERRRHNSINIKASRFGLLLESRIDRLGSRHGLIDGFAVILVVHRQLGEFGFRSSEITLLDQRKEVIGRRLPEPLRSAMRRFHQRISR